MSKIESGNAVGPLNPESLVRHIEQQTAAPVHLWDPPFCGEMDMRIAVDGTWYHQGQPIRRPAMVQLFSSVLKKEKGRYYLVTPVEKVGIQVEDCPFVARTLEVSGRNDSQQLKFTLNTKEQITAGAEHMITVREDPLSGEPHPLIHVRNGLNALISRNVFYQLVELAEHRERSGVTSTFVRSNKHSFQLGSYQR